MSGRGDVDGSTAITLSDYVNSQFDASLSWRDLDWVRSESGLPIMLKGIQTVADAQRAVSEGVEAIALSNHGGRQYDGSPAPIDLLPGVMQAVGDGIEVLVDGGVRRGSDVVKACALGARAVMFGRPYLYGLGAAGEPGSSGSSTISRRESRARWRSLERRIWRRCGAARECRSAG